jgi:hypothetical protein
MDGRLHGRVCRYKGSQYDNDCPAGLVYVTDHTYLSGGRVSNWVNFTYLRPDGRFTKKTGGDYDKQNFKVLKSARVRTVTTIRLPKKRKKVTA